MVLDTSLFNTQHYKVRIKGKVEQFMERCSALPIHLGVVATEKGALGSPLTKGRQLLLIIVVVTFILFLFIHSYSFYFFLFVCLSYWPLYLDVTVLADQREFTYDCFVWTQYGVGKTCCERWMIETEGKKERVREIRAGCQTWRWCWWWWWFILFWFLLIYLFIWYLVLFINFLIHFYFSYYFLFLIFDPHNSGYHTVQW